MTKSSKLLPMVLGNNIGNWYKLSFQFIRNIEKQPELDSDYVKHGVMISEFGKRLLSQPDMTADEKEALKVSLEFFRGKLNSSIKSSEELQNTSYIDEGESVCAVFSSEGDLLDKDFNVSNNGEDNDRKLSFAVQESPSGSVVKPKALQVEESNKELMKYL